MVKKHDEPPPVNVAPGPTAAPWSSPSGQVWSALLAVRDKFEGSVPCDSIGDDGQTYASAEAVVTTARALLQGSSLLLLPGAGRVDVREVVPSVKSYVLVRPFLLMHTVSQEWYWFATEVAFERGSARSLTDACAAAMTTTLAYAYRDLLCLPRASGRQRKTAEEPMPLHVADAMDERALAATPDGEWNYETQGAAAEVDTRGGPAVRLDRATSPPPQINEAVARGGIVAERLAATSTPT